MIIKDTLQSVELDGDNMLFNHVFDYTDEMKTAQKFRKNNDGNWSDDREMRLIGHIPAGAVQILMKTKPEVLKDAKLLKKWIYSEEGQAFRTNTALDTGKSGQVIVK